MYQISDVKKFVKCPKLFQLEYFGKSKIERSYLNICDDLNELLRKKLKIENYLLEHVSPNIPLTKDDISNYKWTIDGHFKYEQLNVKIPFIKKQTNGYDIYFLKLATYPKKDDYLRYLISYYVLLKNNIKVNNVKIIYLNSKYYRDKAIDVDNLFKVSKHFYENEKTKGKSISYSLRVKTNINKLLNGMNAINSDTVIEEIHPTKCNSRVKCSHLDTCTTTSYPDDSILTLRDYRQKKNDISEDVVYLKDIDLNIFNCNQKQFAQIKASKNNGEYYDNSHLTSFIKKYQNKPVVFIDFEWDTYVIPPYKKMKVFDSLPFQYSMHIIDQNDNIIHKEFLGIKDCRMSFITSFINDLPKDTPIFAFNAQGGEIIRLKDLSRQFKKYSKELEDIIDRIVDLSYIFSDGYYYNIKMRGAYSLKAISKAITDIDYDIEVCNGVEAVIHHRLYEKTNGQDLILKEQLLNYCKLDTLVLLKIYKYLEKLIIK